MCSARIKEAEKKHWDTFSSNLRQPSLITTDIAIVFVVLHCRHSFGEGAHAWYEFASILGLVITKRIM